MRKNILINNLILYKIVPNTIQAFKSVLLISLVYGWVLIPLKNSKNLQLECILFGYIRLYKFFFKIKGFGFKWKYQIDLKKQTQIVYFKLGYTHRIALLANNDSKYFLKKRRFIIKNRSYCYIRHSLNLLFFLYKKYLYNKKGLYLRGLNFKLKLSKKKTKF